MTDEPRHRAPRRIPGRPPAGITPIRIIVDGIDVNDPATPLETLRRLAAEADNAVLYDLITDLADCREAMDMGIAPDGLPTERDVR